MATYDFDGDGPPLLLAHATGFHARVLSPLAAALRSSFRSVGFDLRGHGDTVVPAGVDYHWDGFADDALAAVDGLDLDSPFGFGHSSGGAALLLAEAARPGTFRGLYCFEPIVWPDRDFAEARAERMSEGALRRRPSFPSKAEALANYKSKPPLAGFDAAALAAYVEAGFAEAEDGSVRLKCSPEVEAAVYRMAPAHDGFARLRAVRCPVVVARGADSDAVAAEVIAQQVGALPAGALEELDGLSHFGPMEAPEIVAESVARAFKGLAPRSGGA